LTHHRLVDDVRIVGQSQCHPICATPLFEGFFTMKTAMQFLLFMLIAVLVIVMAVMLGDSGAWYFAWLIGTAMIVLIAAAGGALLDAQDERARSLKES
jgi:predicted outer membrane lipoprotein